MTRQEGRGDDHKLQPETPQYVVTTVYFGQRKFLHNAGRHSVAVESVEYADKFPDIDSACEAAYQERKSRRWRGFSWHEAESPPERETEKPEMANGASNGNS